MYGDGDFAYQEELQAARKQIPEQPERMRAQAEQPEQHRMEFKHLMVEKEKQVAESKNAAEKTMYRSKKQAVVKKTLTDEEQRKEIKGLDVEAGMNGLPNTKQVAEAKKSGKGNGKDGVAAPKVAARGKDAGPLTMVTKKGQPSIYLSPNLANVSA